MERMEKTRQSLPARLLHRLRKGIHKNEKIDEDDHAVEKFTSITTGKKKDKKDMRLSSPPSFTTTKERITKPKQKQTEVERLRRMSTASKDSGFSYGNDMSSVLPDISDISEPISEDDEGWLDSLDVSEDPQTFDDPPEEFYEFIERFAKEHNLKNLSWAPSAKKNGEYVIFGSDLSPEIIKQFDKVSPRRLSNLPIQFVSSNFVSQNLSGRIVEYTCNQFNQPVRWEGSETTTCELIISAKEPHKADRLRLFAVTSAHLLLTDQEMLPFESEDHGGDDLHGNPQNLRIRELREDVNKRMDRHVYALQFRTTGETQSLHLSHPPLFSYRYYQDIDVGDDQNSKPFMNDIAVFSIEPENIITLKTALLQDHCRLDSMKPLSPVLLQKMVDRQVKIYAKGREGKLWPMREGVQAIGYHMSFKLTRGEPFERGDSGSVIFTKAGDKKFALALLKGSRPEPQQDIYEAIILEEAIKDIQKDYPRLLQNAKLYIPNFGPNPVYV